MKKRKISVLLMFIGVSLMGSSINFLQGQGVAKQGLRGKYIEINTMLNYLPNALSPNGKYVGGAPRGVFQGFIYDVVRDTAWTMDCAVTGVSNDRSVISGDFYYSGPNGQGGHTQSKVWRDGAWEVLDPGSVIPSEEAAFWKGSSSYGVAGNSKDILSMYYKKSNGIYINVFGTYQGTKLNKEYKGHWPMAVIPVNNTGYGYRANAISEDGKTIVGHSSMPQTGGCLQLCPVYWQGDTSYYLGDDAFSGSGSLTACSGDGNFMVGYLEEKGLYYEKGKKRIFVSPPIGYGELKFFGISSKGEAIGIVQNLAAENRRPVIYTPSNGLVFLEDYLYEMYRLDLRDRNLFSISNISSDGKVLSGWFSGLDGNDKTYVILLDQALDPSPRSLSAIQQRDQIAVNVSWDVPLVGNKKLLGYNVYCDSIKINSELVSTLEYVHVGVLTGKHIYHITAVYDGATPTESLYSEAAKIEVVEAGGCFSVKTIDNEIEYNRCVSVYWGLPTSVLQDKSSKSICFSKGSRELKAFASAVKLPETLGVEQGYENEGYDFVSAHKMGSITTNNVIQIGKYYYASDYVNLGIRQYDSKFKLIKIIQIEGLPATYNLATVGNRVFAGCGTKFIYELDLERATIIKARPVDEKVNHIAYIPELDEGRGGFELGEWDKNNILVDMNGKYLSPGFEFQVAAGTIYYNGYVYAFEQTGSSFAELRQYSLQTKKSTGKVVNVGAMPAVKALGNKEIVMAAGLSLIYLEDSTLCFGAMLQPNVPGGNQLAFLEVKSAPNLLGYTIYRNNVALNTKPYTSRTYRDTIDIPGTYTYSVQTIKKNCSSEHSLTTQAIISDKGVCMPVQKVKGLEISQNTFLSWESPLEGSLGRLLGFNIYRDGKQIYDKYDRFKYTDVDPGVGRHLYRIEAFYDNSCVASDSLSIEITHAGIMNPPSNLQLSSTVSSTDSKKQDVKASWELPYFETPLPIGYAQGVLSNGVSVQGYNDIGAFIGWDTSNLKMYKGYKLVGMEFAITDEVTSCANVVILNNTIVYEKSMGRVRVLEPITVFFDQTFSMDQPVSVEVGYYITFNQGKSPAGLDISKANSGFGDIFVVDNYQRWGELKRDLNLPYNWFLTALVIKERDLAKYGSDWKNNPEALSLIQRAKVSNVTPLVTPLKSPIKVSAEPYQLSGFNIYRDNIKLNTDLYKDLSYTDKNLKDGTYEYVIGSIWNKGAEAELYTQAKSITIEMLANEALPLNNWKVYPNPCTNNFNIEGSYQSLSILDVTGKIVMQVNSPSACIDINNLSPGIYFVRIEKDFLIGQYKLIKK